MFTAKDLADLYPAPMPTASKEDFRAWAKTTRTRIAAAPDIAEVHEAVCTNITSYARFRDATHVMFYIAFGSEVRLRRVLEFAPDKTYYTTRIENQKTGEMTVRKLAGAALIKHPFGPLEPSADAEIVPETRLDVVLVPGLAFDERGARLGYGMGFYDRILAKLRPDAVRIGITLDALVVPTLPSEDHDERMHVLITESGVCEL